MFFLKYIVNYLYGNMRETCIITTLKHIGIYNVLNSKFYLVAMLAII